MSIWHQYSKIKNLIDQYYDLKEVNKYDEFTKKLIEILEI